MYPRPLPEIAELKPAVHGGATSPDLIDFSTGVSPLPPPLGILTAIRGADVTSYPSPSGLPLREVIAHHHGLDVSQVVAGSGSTELIWAIARSFAGHGRTALILAPTFGEYEQAVRAAGGRIEKFQAAPTFQWDFDQLSKLIDLHRPSVVFACRPNNPTLSLFPIEHWLQLIRSVPETLFVVDEAYLPMFEGVKGVPGAPNVARLRSLTKIFALPGLRVGYLLTDSPVAAAVQASLPPWNLSAPAIAGGIAAMMELDGVSGVRESIARLREEMIAGLKQVDARIDAAGGPFVLCHVGDARSFCRKMESQRIRLRDCTSFGLPAHVRLGARDVAAQDALFKGWRLARMTD